METSKVGISLKKMAEELLNELQSNGELPLIEMHIIRAVGPTLLNRDFNNMVKKITYGGATRVRFSSQSVMKAIRDFRSGIDGARESSNIHSRYLPEHLSRIIASRGEEYAALADFVKENFTTNKKKDGATAQIIVYAEHDVEEIADIIIKKYNEDRDGFLKDDTILNGTDMKGKMVSHASARKVDDMTALKGRMSTDLHYVDSIESAASINHAYSVDEWKGDTDFFVATDDADRMLSFITGDTDDVNGSGMIEDLDIAANVFYQYANIDTRTLLENCLRGVDLDDKAAVDSAVRRMQKIASNFIADFATIVPEAKQHAMASKPAPSCMLITAKKWARAQSADSVFVDVIEGRNSKGVVKDARDRLVKFINAAQNGAFAIEEFQNILWLEDDTNGDIPENAKRSSLKDASREIFG